MPGTAVYQFFISRTYNFLAYLAPPLLPNSLCGTPRNCYNPKPVPLQKAMTVGAKKLTMTEKKQNLHPFGKLLTHYLWQNHTSQSQLAEATDISDSIISRMKHGQRLSGDNARERVLKMIEYFHQQGVLSTRQEADEWLASAGMIPLSPEPFDKWCLALEPKLYDQLIDCAVRNGDGRDEPPLAKDKKRRELRVVLPDVSPKALWLMLTAVVLGGFIIYGAYFYHLVNGWSLLISRTDDRNVVLVNDEIITVDKDRGDDPLLRLNLNRFMREQDASVITLINLNGIAGAAWDFELRRNNRTLWQSEGNRWGEYQMNFARSIQVAPDGQLEEVKYPLAHNSFPVPITITLDVQTVALVYVNGFPVGGAFDSPSGEFIPIALSPFLKPDQENLLELKFWSPSGRPYRWQVEIRQNHLLWLCTVNGASTGTTLSEQFIIDGTGEIVYTGGEGSCRS